MKVAIIDYGSGNLHSAAKAFERAGKGIAEIIVTSEPADLKTATHIVLPGVGAFADCKRGLESVTGMIAELETQVLKNKKPFFGICVGMQLLATTGLEHGKHKGLGWIDGVVERLQVTGSSLKIPHMGWNNLLIAPEKSTDFSMSLSATRTEGGGHLTANLARGRQILQGVSNKDFYFVHSYHLVPDEDVVVATVDYGGEVVAAVQKENIFGTQFHPEKSQAAGLQLIQNFINWQG